jgi:hypothetical protein
MQGADFTRPENRRRWVAANCTALPLFVHRLCSPGWVQGSGYKGKRKREEKPVP